MGYGHGNVIFLPQWIDSFLLIVIAACVIYLVIDTRSNKKDSDK